jgi:PEGA domain
MLPSSLISPRFLVALVPFAFALLTLSPAARAQTAQTVSDADRAAARELATEGLQLQQAGNFADALDRFDRAQAVFSAPTHLLHIAECEAALGKLVEAAETYRTLVRTPLPAGAPGAFVQAQQEGAAELSLLEPRIPSIRVLVRPRAQPNMTVQIDGQPMSAALIGVQRPTDPGTHSVVLLAPGYARAEQRIVLREKETKDVAFNLGGAPGGYYSPPPPVSAPAPTTSQPPPPPPPQPTYIAQPEAPPLHPEPEEARGGIMVGATLGVLIPAGNIYQGTAMSSALGSGVGLAIDGGFRFVKRLYLGLEYQHGFLGAGTLVQGSAPSGGTASADSNYIGLDFAYISNPDGAGFFGKVGAGYRFVDIGVVDPSSPANAWSQTFQGGEVSLGVGIHVRVGPWVRLIPLASINAGQFGSSSCTPSGTAASPASLQCGSVANGDTHMFVLLGMTAFVDFARKH